MNYLQILRSKKPYVERAGREIVVPNIGRGITVANVDDVSSVVTETDLAVGQFLLPLLREQYPESFAEEDMNRGYVDHRWLLDNVDGTGEFVSGVYRGSSIVLGLLDEQNIPVAGLIHIPQTRETLYGTRRSGPFYEVDGKQKKLALPPQDKIVVSQRQLAQVKKLNEFLECLSDKTKLPVEVVMTGGMGSAFLRLMTGELNLYIFPVGDTKEWDTAAVEPMLYRLRGDITDLSGHRLRYGRYGEYGVWHTNGVIASCGLPNRLNHENVIRHLAEFSSRYGSILVEKVTKR